MSESYQSILGLPFSGKTSFLAALWHTLITNDIQTKLMLDKHIGDHEHLNAIAEAWAKCDAVERTSQGKEAFVEIKVRDSVSGITSSLKFPDLSGERFEAMVERRVCPPALIEAFDGDSGALLFITANRKTDGLKISQIEALDDGEEAPVEMESPAAETAQVAQPLAAIDVSQVAPELSEPKKWDASMLPVDVKLVEVLQLLSGAPFSIRKRRLGLIISAWDLVTGNRSPDQWLAAEMPLLSQFIETNTSCFEFKIFGVSATGGVVHGKSKAAQESRSKLLNMPASERIKCVSGVAVSNDITTPIAWVMGVA